jgi:hypothetical protein
MFYTHILLLVSVVLTSLAAKAATHSVILPSSDQALIIVQKMDRQTGEIDKDPDTLMELMAQPAKEGPNGDKVKFIETPEKDFVLKCVVRATTGTLQCHFLIYDSPEGKIDAAAGQVFYQAQGELAQGLYEQFVHKNNESLEFVTSDSRLIFTLEPTQVTLSYQAD